MAAYNITIALIGISTGFLILYLIRRNAIHVRYTFWWIFISISISALSIFPQLSDRIVGFFGIHYAPSFFFFAAILLLFIKILLMDIDRSKQEVRIRRLIQRLAMLEADLNADHKESSSQDR